MDKAEKGAKEWIFAARKKGWSDEDIGKEMLKKGYSQRAIRNLLEEFPEHRKWTKYLLPIIVIAVVVGLAIEIYLNFAFFYVNDCKNDSNCFIYMANQCKAAKMETIIAGSVYDFSEKNCVLTKTLALMNDSEPSDLRDLLEYKNMTCSYEKGSFDPNLINTVSLGIEGCTGDLADGLNSIIESI